MNYYGMIAIYLIEVRKIKTYFLPTIVAPIVTSILYLTVFGNIVASRVYGNSGVEYRAFMIPGLLILSTASYCVSSGSSGFLMRQFNGTINELLAAPLSTVEIALSTVAASTSKCMLLVVITLLTSATMVEFEILHPLSALFVVILTAICFSTLGLTVALISGASESIQALSIIIITPLVFLGGSFYSLDLVSSNVAMLTRLNPLYYIISGLRSAFFETENRVLFTLGFLVFSIIALLLVLQTFGQRRLRK